MTHATSKRRGRGEDSIYWDAAKSCYVGAVSLGYSPYPTTMCRTSWPGVEAAVS